MSIRNPQNDNDWHERERDMVNGYNSKVDALTAERDALRVQVRALAGHVEALINLAVELDTYDPTHFQERLAIIAEALAALREAREAVQG